MSPRKSDEPRSHRAKRSKKYQRLTKQLGRRVRALREERGLTLEQADEKSGMDWRHLHKLEMGSINPTLVTLYRIAEGLGVEIRDLFEPVDE